MAKILKTKFSRQNRKSKQTCKWVTSREILNFDCCRLKAEKSEKFTNLQLCSSILNSLFFPPKIKTDFKQSFEYFQAASQENLINVESTVMSSSTSRIVSTAFYDESGFKEDSTGKKIKFPIETYQGLEKATAERVRRFVDETKANLMRGRLESSPNLNNARTTSGKKNLVLGSMIKHRRILDLRDSRAIC